MASTDPSIAPARAARHGRLTAAIVLLLVFAAGLVAGAVGDRLFLLFHERIVPPGGLQVMARHLVRHLDRKLDLTEAQEAEVRRILERRTAGMTARMGALHRELHGEMLAANDEIAAILTPEQQRKFATLRQRWESGHKRR